MVGSGLREIDNLHFTWKPSIAVNLKFLIKIANITFISFKANLLPIQERGPVKKGM